MTQNFQEVLAVRNELLHRKAIWQEVHDHLAKFVDTDVKRAEMGIKSDGEGLFVPQDLIIETREGILADLADITDQLVELDNREVAEDDEEGEGEESDEAAGEQEAGHRSEED